MVLRTLNIVFILLIATQAFAQNEKSGKKRKVYRTQTGSIIEAPKPLFERPVIKKKSEKKPLEKNKIKRSKKVETSYKNELGGLSGKPIFLNSTILLKKMYSLTNGQITLVGVGGVSSGHECYEKIKAGASLVQLYTALVYHGPKIINEILKELDALILIDGYKNVSEAIGKSS